MRIKEEDMTTSRLKVLLLLAIFTISGFVYGQADVTDNRTSRIAGPAALLTEDAFIDNPNPTFLAGFGFAVALHNDILVIGAPGEDFELGAAYVYYRDENEASGWRLIKRITDSDGIEGDLFGYDVDVHGDTIIVTSILEYDAAMLNEIGSVYVYRQNEGGPDNWGLVKQLTPSMPQDLAEYGETIAIYGDTIVVGADDTDVGSDEIGVAYVYERNLGGPENWGEAKILIPSDGTDEDDFGEGVDIWEDIIVIGSERAEDAFGEDIGAFYIFYRDEGGPDNWGEVVKRTGSEAIDEGAFGYEVALHGSYLVVGAPGETIDSTLDAGAAYLFGKDVGGTDNWGEIRRLEPVDARSDNDFGFVVAIYGDTVLVQSSFSDSPVQTEAGVVFVYRRNSGGNDNWGLEDTLYGSDDVDGNEFGQGLAIQNNTVICGTPFWDDKGGGLLVGSADAASPRPQYWKYQEDNHTSRSSAGAGGSSPGPSEYPLVLFGRAAVFELGGSLQVKINPNGAEAEGRWFIPGQTGLMTNGQTLEDLTPGVYPVFFTDVPGWITPERIRAVVLTRDHTLINGTYAGFGAGPRIRYFTATPDAGGAGEPILLNWFVEGADSVSIDGVATGLTDSGSIEVSPTETTVYRLQASNAFGATSGITRFREIEPPTILWFLADNGTEPINKRVGTTLRWGIDGATRVRISEAGAAQPAIDQAVDEETGSVDVKPKSSTVYTLTASNQAGSTSADLTVDVNRLPYIERFSAFPLAVVTGEMTTFTWEVLGRVRTVAISPETDDQVRGAKGSADHQPTESDTYVLEAANNGGATSRSLTLSVTDPKDATDLRPEITAVNGTSPSATAKVTAGSLVPVEVTLHNDGGGKALEVEVQLLANGQLADRLVVDRINGGSSRDRTFYCIAGSTGTMELEIIVDPDGLIADVDRSNNSDTAEKTVLDQEGVDLAVTQLDVTRIDGEKNGTILVSFAVTNVGDQEAEFFQVDLRAGSAGSEADQTVWSGHIDRLAPGQTMTYRQVFKLPGGMLPRFILNLRCDTYGAVFEDSNAGNNILQRQWHYEKLP